MQERYGEIAKTILLGIGLTGAIVVVAAAPGLMLALKLFPQGDERFTHKTERQKALRTFNRMRKNQLLSVREKNGKVIVELTKDGKRVFRQLQIEKLHIPKPPQWDGKWRLVIFDIPEDGFRLARSIFRAKLKEWEFYLLQKSVWVCPWPCEKEIQILSKLYGIERYVDLIVAEKIANDGKIRKHFSL
jgi:DNA-binding transcriptional regulator PaaX